MEAKQKKLFNKNIFYYDLAGCEIQESAVDSTVESGGGGGKVYESGLRPPYILEQWAIHTLKAIAQKQNIDESKTVTKEHVIALIAFAIGEGGDIQNQDLFNPLNTGIDAPELLDGPHSGSGVQAFKSFDAGVEGLARTMVGKNQNRTAKVLSDEKSTAAEFMKALTYFKRYKGNKLWAEDSTPDPARYYSGRLSLVKQVRSNYKDFASLVIGTPAHEQAEGKREPSKLSPDLSADSGGGADDDDSGSGCECNAPDSETPDVLRGSENEEKAYNFFIDNKLSPVEAAGIVGNFMQESGMNPQASNGSHEGIGQWSSDIRWPKLVDFAKKQKGDKSPRSLLVQLKYTLEEAPTNEYRNSKPKTAAEAATKFEDIFENSGGSALDKRIAYAEDALKKFDKNQASESSSSDSGAGCPEPSNGKAVIVDGHAWPVDIGKDEISPNLPCRQSSCHHDGTPAFDFTHKDTAGKNKDNKAVGKAVFAIADGEIAKIDLYMGISGCYDMEFKADDGYVYWYGHIRKPVSQKAGKKFKVGDKVAEIGERKCTGNKSYPHLHIDRGSPKGNFGGMECCRDPGMNDLINGLYEKLP